MNQAPQRLAVPLPATSPPAICLSPMEKMKTHISSDRFPFKPTGEKKKNRFLSQWKPPKHSTRRRPPAGRRELPLAGRWSGAQIVSKECCRTGAASLAQVSGQNMAVARQTSKWNPGKWKHGPKPAVCPSCLLLSHTHMSTAHLVGLGGSMKASGHLELVLCQFVLCAQLPSGLIQLQHLPGVPLGGWERVPAALQIDREGADGAPRADGFARARIPPTVPTQPGTPKPGDHGVTSKGCTCSTGVTTWASGKPLWPG